MRVRTVLWIGGLCLAAFLALVLATHSWGLGAQPDGRVRFGSLLEDDYDRFAYEQRGRWLPARGQPYLDVFSEYPQLSTWFLGLPYLFFEHQAERGEPFGSRDAAVELLLAAGLGEPPKAAELPPDKREQLRRQWAEQFIEKTPKGQRPQWLERLAQPPRGSAELRAAVERAWEAQGRLEQELLRNAAPYADVHQCLMFACALALLALTALCLRELGAPPAHALWLLLPGYLYFSFSRFDALPAAVVMGAVYAQLRGRSTAAGALLGVAAMLKIWPLALWPLFASHAFLASADAPQPGSRAERARRQILLPGLACAGVCALVLGSAYLAAGGGARGWDAVTRVYLWHEDARKPNHSSILALATAPERWGWFDPALRDSFERVLPLLQAGPAVLLALIGLKRREAWLAAVCCCVLCIVQFQKFFSPQWVLWVAPIALCAAARARALRWFAIATGLVIYVQLPLLWYYERDPAGPMELPAAFWSATNARVLVLFAFSLVALWVCLRARVAGVAPPDGATHRGEGAR